MDPGWIGFLNQHGGEILPVKKTKEVILEVLQEEGEMGTSEIYQIVCTILYHGVTMNQLTNILSRTKQIEAVGWTNHSINGFRIREKIWRFKE